MKWNLRLGLPVMAVGAALIVAGLLLALSPWSGEDAVQEAAGGSIQYRLCNTTLQAPGYPDTLAVSRAIEWTEQGLKPALRVRVRKGDASFAEISPQTGTVLTEQYATAADEALVKAVLDTLGVAPLDASAAAWPYGDASQMPPERVEDGVFKFRAPDPASGMIAWVRRGEALDPTTLRTEAVQVLILANCRSAEARGVFPFTGEERPRVRDVHPDDEAAFQTFYDEVAVKRIWP